MISYRSVQKSFMCYEASLFSAKYVFSLRARVAPQVPREGLDHQVLGDSRDVLDLRVLKVLRERL